MKSDQRKPGTPVSTSGKLSKKLLVSLVGVSLGMMAFATHAEEERDSAGDRARWRAEWYEEGSAAKVKENDKHGGRLSIEFRRKMLETADKERGKWGHMIPGVSGQGSVLGTATKSGSTAGSTTTSNTLLAAAATGTTWVNMGPTKADVAKNGGTSLAISDAGRPTGIVFDPANASIIYAAFAGGGLWKTTDGGATWAPKTESLGTLSVGTVAMDPNNSAVLYLGLGDAFDGTGIGMVKSTDGGTTWSSPVYLGDSTVINAVQVAPSNSNIVLAATNKGVYRSQNAGASWTLLTLPTGQTGVPYAWSIAWTGGSSFAVSVEATPGLTTGTTNGQVLVTGDNGNTWTKATGLAATGPDFSTGFTDGGTATQTGIAAQAPGGTGIANAMDVRLAGGAGQAPGTVASSSGGSSFLDDLLNKGKGMMNSRMVTDTAGRVITGYAQGKAQEAQLAARKAEIDNARANARFAAAGSRYNPVGMINSSNFKAT